MSREAMKLALNLATMHHSDDGYQELRQKVRRVAKAALAEQPAQREPLTEEMVCQLAEQYGAQMFDTFDHNGYTKAVEAAHGIMSKQTEALAEQSIGCQCPACQKTLHASDCAVHNAPAYPVGNCDCGAQQDPVAHPFEDKSVISALSWAAKLIEQSYRAYGGHNGADSWLMNYADKQGERIRQADHREWEKVNGRWQVKSTPPAQQEPDYKSFMMWADIEAYDTARKYDTEHSRWVFLDPLTDDLWKAWRASRDTKEST